MTTMRNTGIHAGLRPVMQAAFMLAFLAMGCDSDAPEPGPSPGLRSMHHTEAELINTSNELAIDLARLTFEGDKKSNIFISPFNMSMAFGALLNGASEEPGNRIREFMGITQYSSTEINKAYSEIRALFEVVDPDVSLRMVNGIWAPLEYRFDDSFATRVMAYYDAEVRELDFTRDVSVKMINRWGALKSGGMIPDLVQTAPTGTGMLYTGGAVFKGAFSYPFDSELTHRGLFDLGKKAVEVDMLQARSMPVRYFQGDDASLVEVDYGVGYYCLSLLIPEGDTRVGDLLNNLRVESFTVMIEKADSLYANISMPRFQIDYKRSFSDLFRGAAVDRIMQESLVMDRMFEEKIPDEMPETYFRALIQNEMHGSFSTGAYHGYHLNYAAARNLVIDRPFLFFVREKHTNAILFFGAMRDPRL
jgi:serpin B